MKAMVAHSPTRSILKSVPRPTPKNHLMDDAAAEAVAQIGDQLARADDLIRGAINELNRSTYEQGALHRKRAHLLVKEAWAAMAIVDRAASALSEPAPRFRPDANGPRPIVRKRRDADGEPVMADIRLVSLTLPARMGVAR